MVKYCTNERRRRQPFRDPGIAAGRKERYFSGNCVITPFTIPLQDVNGELASENIEFADIMEDSGKFDRRSCDSAL